MYHYNYISTTKYPFRGKFFLKLEEKKKNNKEARFIIHLIHLKHYDIEKN